MSMLISFKLVTKRVKEKKFRIITLCFYQLKKIKCLNVSGYFPNIM